ncbi:MAG: hypothetical protein IMX01_03210 [Limnochordaceae bacterium]|nr:hypothetical protein [Limnochordaceae bacterium]
MQAKSRQASASNRKHGKVPQSGLISWARTPVPSIRSSPPGRAAAEPGDPQVEWDEWEPEVYSTGFGPAGRDQ